MFYVHSQKSSPNVELYSYSMTTKFKKTEAETTRIV